MDLGHDRKGAGRDGSQVFGLAAGKKKLPLTEMGKTAHGPDIWRGCGAAIRASLWTRYV